MNKPRTIPQMPDLADYITTEEAANKLGFHIISVRRLVRAKKLDAIKAGPIWLVSKKAVEKYLKQTATMDKHDPRRGQ